MVGVRAVGWKAYFSIADFETVGNTFGGTLEPIHTGSANTSRLALVPSVVRHPLDPWASNAVWRHWRAQEGDRIEAAEVLGGAR